ncbi:hypothetical protein [Micromonospora sp. CB01531]|uniref:hypothetical protein n=1 Tax=Micromonospora sp. CB01531 TaxID=1718947 RepID=UPI000A5C131F|nr:hypothetical protein [Micromonospora sp. CB01531]
MKFRSVRSTAGLRGITVDVVVFDFPNPTYEAMQAVMPNIAGSPDGEVIRP